MSIIPFILQTSALVLFFVFLVLSFVRHNEDFRHKFLVLEVLFSILLFCCILFANILNLGNHPAFTNFALLLVACLGGYWLNKINLAKFKPLQYVTLSFAGGLFWLALLMTYDFREMLPFCIFPFFGIFIILPLFYVILSISEMRYQAKSKPDVTVWKTLLLGVLPIIVTQLVINYTTTEPWQLFDLLLQKIKV